MSKSSLLEKNAVHPLRSLPRFKVKTLALLTGGVICAALLPPDSYAELPDPCRGGCGPAGNLQFVQAGAATYNTSNNTMTVTQTTDKAVLNWNSFNVSQDAAVNFAQKNASSVALNRVFSGTPSKILGSVTGNGQIYLINPSGILFGKTAKINVGGLVASTLNVDTNTFMNSGIANAVTNKDQSNLVAKDDYAAFRNKDGEFGEHDASQKVVVEAGASIKTNGAGNIILVGKTVENHGSIEANDGQVLLVAAEDRVFLQPSDELALRGFLVEMETGGEVTNTGEVKADRGNVTLAGHAVNQHGVVKATTSLDRNGSIYLQARDGGDAVAGTAGKKNTLKATRGGSLSVGESSLTSIELELDSLDKAIEEQDHLQSRVKLAGQTVHIKENAQIKAHNGIVDVLASSTPDKSLTSGTGNAATRDDLAYIQMDSGAKIDVQGADASLEMSRNFVTLELFSSELKDSPLQRNGILRGEEITVDIRKGTPLADISAAIAAVPKSLAERASEGGSVNLMSQGAVVLNSDSTIDVSGGEITYEGGFVATTKLLSNGRVVDISEADPSIVYDGILGVYTQADRKQGLIFREGRPVSSRFWESGYTAGRDAGNVTIAGYNMRVEGDIVSNTVAGRYQTTPATSPSGGTLNIGLPRDFGAFIDNLAPSVALTAGQMGQQAADVKLADIEVEFRMELANALRVQLQTDNPDLTDDELAEALRAELAKSVVQDQLKARYIAALGENNQTSINIDKLSNAGLQTINIRSNGAVTVEAANNPLQMADVATLSVSGDKITIDRSISSAGGTLAFKTQSNIANSVQVIEDASIANGITLADGVTLDVSGEYINDIYDVALPESRSMAIDGGSISLAVSGSEALRLGADNRLLADGGAYVSRKGKVDDGRGGAITLDASALDASFNFSGAPIGTDSTVNNSQGLVLSARGLKDNGTLTLGAEGFLISDADQFKATGEGMPTAISSDDETGFLSRLDQGIKGNQLSMSSAFFEDGAFSDYRLKASRGDVIIDANTNIDLVQRNFALSEDSVEIETADSLRSLASIETLDTRLRNAVDFSVAQKTNLDADLIVGTGASITTDAGGQLSFANGSQTGGARILIDGRIQADAGEISLKLTRENSTAAVNDRSLIWLGENAELLSRGYFDQDYNEEAPDTALGQRIIGEVLDGGNINVTASGYIVMQEGSQIDVSGTHADMDIFVDYRQNVTTQYDRQQISGAAGQVNLNAGEGMVLAGDFLANSDAISASDTQSSLTIQSSFGDRNVSANGGTDPALIDPARHIQVVTNRDASLPENFITTQTNDIASYFRSGEQAIAIGAMTSADRGITVLNADKISSAFDNLSVKTDGILSFGETTGEVSPVELSLDRSLNIDTKYLRVNDAGDGGQQVVLNSAFIDLGGAESPQGVGANSTGIPHAGSGQITVNASAIDIRNSLYIDGIRSLALNAEDDIRLRDMGTVSSTGDIILSARQVIATTASDLHLQALDIVDGATPQAGRIVINDNGKLTGPVLAAQGKVTLTAANIEQNGTLLAPFGSITLDAVHLQTDGTTITRGEKGSLALSDDSVTSVSLNDMTVPFGSTLNGLEWVYGTNSQKIFTDGEQNVLNPAVSLQGDDIHVASGAQVDISGGGDLVAYEFIPGLGGSKDYLDIAADGFEDGVERYAILPALGNASIPFDQKYSTTSGAPAVGTTIKIGAGSALPAGEYLLLPAQYAMLQGAYIVEKVDGYRDVSWLYNFKLMDGTPVVSGTQSVAGLDTLTMRQDGYSIRPGSDARQFSEYRETGANQFFTERAAMLDLAVTPARPVDAALASINAGTDLRLDGQILGEAGEGGRGSALDISADRLQVVNSSQGGADDAVVLTADQLANLEVGSLLLGGRRTTTEQGLSIDVLADQVSVEEGVNVTGNEIILVATEAVNIKQNASVHSQSAATSERLALTVNNGGAAVAVSQRFITEINRTGAESGASISVDSNAHIASANSVVMDSTGSTTFAGSLSAPGALHLGAARVELGRVTGEGLVLDPSTLAGLAGVDLLGIQASEQMVLADGVTVSADTLRLTTPLLSGAMSSTGEARINANTLTLAGGEPTAETTTGQGKLTIDVQTLALGSETLAIGGIDRLDVFAQKAMQFAEDGNTQIAANAVNINTPLVYGGDGITSTLSVSGDLAFVSNGAVANEPSGLGAKVDVNAAALHIDNTWQFDSGVVGLHASSGDLRVGSQAQLDVSGREFSVYETSLYSDAGQVSLSSQQGNVDVQSGAKIDISAPNGGGDAGALMLNAANGDVNMAGTLMAGAALGDSGRLGIDAQRYTGGLDALATLMQGSGAHGGVDMRLRTHEQQLLSAGQEIQAKNIDLAFDNAGVVVQGELDASGERGGTISIQANGDVQLGNTSRLVAQGTSDRGGSVLVSAHNGALAFDSGATIDVSGREGGEVVLRADIDDVNGVEIADGGFAGTIVGARRARLEVHDTPYLDSGDFDQSDAEALLARAQAIQARATAIRERLGINPAVDVAASLEIVADGAYTWNHEVNLDEWQVYSEVGTLAEGSVLPGTLTVRATGNLTIQENLSDGFTTKYYVDGNGDPVSSEVLSDKDSWSFRLVAGADLASANVLKTTANANADVSIMNDVKIRTGTGDVQIAAAQNINFANDGAAVYAAGRDIGLALDRFDHLSLQPSSAPGNKMVAGEGGSVSIVAGGNINGQVNRTAGIKPWTEWLVDNTATPGVFLPDDNGDPILDPVTGDALYLIPREDAGRYVQFDMFSQGVAAFGSGDVKIATGGDVVKLNVSLPSAVHIDQISGQATEIGNGNLSLMAGGKIISSNFLIGQGRGKITSQDSILADSAEAAPGLSMLLGGKLSYVARKDVHLLSAFDAATVTRKFTGENESFTGYYYSFDDDTSFSAVSIAGDTKFDTNLSAKQNAIFGKQEVKLFGEGEFGQDLLVPSDFFIASFAGNTSIEKLSAFAQPDSRFIVWANDDLNLTGVGEMMDIPTADLVRIGNPEVALGSKFDPKNGIDIRSISPLESHNAEILMVAYEGSLSAPSIFTSAIPVDVYAGKDIDSLHLKLTHYRETDITRVTSVRDINLVGGDEKISVAGPGRLEIMAGRNINLGSSKGIETVGATTNTQLQGRSGADVFVFAGVKAEDLQYNSFIAPMLNNSTTLNAFATEVQTYVNGVTKENLSQRDAAERFRTLSLEQQAAFTSAIAGTQEQTATMLTALAYADAISDTISRSGAYQPLLVNLQSTASGLDVLAESYRLHEGSAASASTVVGLLSSLSQKAQQEVLHYSLALLDEAARRNLIVNTFAGLATSDRKPLISHAFFNELKMSGRNANAGAPAGYDRGYQAADNFFATATYEGDKKLTAATEGNLSLLLSKVYTIDGGDINLFVPGGYVNAGVVTPPLGGVNKIASELGIVAQGEGDVRAYLQGDFLVNQSRVFTLREGDINMWSSAGNIDAGRGAKSAVAAPAPTVSVDDEGNVVINTAGAVAGSGIRQIDTTGEDNDFEAALKERVAARSVDLVAPVGEVNAGDAGIGASGNINIAAARVIGADNIDIGGVAVGVPVADTSGFTGGFSGADSAGSAVSKASEDAADESASDSPEADDALAWLEVTFAGFGDETSSDADSGDASSTGAGGEKKRKKDNG